MFFNGTLHTIYLYDDNDTPDDYTDDRFISMGAAHNNVISTSNGKWEDGVFQMLDKNSPHTHGSRTDPSGILLDSENGAYGTGGIFRAKDFNETKTTKTRSGMGFHAGRGNKEFFKRKTQGCIRIENLFFSDIENAIQNNGPLQKAIIYKNRESDNSDDSQNIFEKLHPYVDSPIKNESGNQELNLNTTG